MFDLKVLCKEDTEKLLEMEEVIKSVESAYSQKAAGEGYVFPLVFNEFEAGVADMDIKSGWLKDTGLYGFKLVSWFGENSKKGLPELVGVIMVFDDKTGMPIGLLDGAHITGMRTGAAGAIGAKYLARKDSKNLMLVGAGNIATFQVAAMLKVFPNIETVTFYDPISYEFAQNKAKDMPNILKEKFNITNIGNVIFSATEEPISTLSIADIVITVTPSREPLIKKEWVKPGTHFSCIGADMSGKEEIAPEIFKDARIFVDDLEQCTNVGEIEIPIKNRIISKNDVIGEIGDVINNVKIGRTNDKEITIFDATGTALLDIITAQLAFSHAEEKKLGSSVNL